MNEEQAMLEMQKPKGAAVSILEWYLLFSFIEIAVSKDGTFSTPEDRDAIINTVKRLHDQVFPPQKDNSAEFADVVMLKPKKIIKGPDLIA